MRLPSRKASMIIAALVILLVTCVFLIDRIYIPYLEDQSRLVTEAWKKELFKITQIGILRAKGTTENSIFETDGIQVSVDKKGKKRIFVIGDSFVCGYALSNINDAWWRVLQRELKQRGWNDVEVVAMFATGGNTAEQLKQLKKMNPLYKPDMIVWGYVADDTSERAGGLGTVYVKELYKLPLDSTTIGMRKIGRVLFPNITEVLTADDDRALAKKVSSSEMGYERKERELKFLEGINFEQYKKTVKKVGEYVKELKIPCVFIGLPAGIGPEPIEMLGKSRAEYCKALRAYYEARYAPVLPLYKQENIRFVSLLDSYISAIEKEPTFDNDMCAMNLAAVPCDSHPGTFATHHFATSVADILERDYATTLGKKSKSEKTPAVDLTINEWLPSAINLKRVNAKSYTLNYPPQEYYLLTMPIHQPHMQLSFENPTSLKTISLSGPSLKESQIWVSAIDERRKYDTHLLHDLGRKKGKQVKWTLPSEYWASHVNTIKIFTKLRGGSDSLFLEFEP